MLSAFAALIIGGCGYFSPSADETATASAPRIHIDVSGVDNTLADNLRAHLSLSQETCDAPEWRVNRLFARAENEARRALRALGYYAPGLEKRLERLPDCWKASFEVTAGEPVLVEAVTVRMQGDAEHDASFADLLSKLPIKPGDPANHAKYEQAKRKISSLAAERGYFDGRFTRSELRIEPIGRKATIDIAYDAGRRYHFGPLTLKQDVLRPELVRDFVDYEQGAPYHSDKLLELNRALSDSGYFARVDVRPETEVPDDHEIPVTVELAPRKLHQFMAGAGLTTDAGPRLRLGYENRRLNRRGHRLNVRASGSLIQRDFTARYRIPLADPRSEWLNFESGLLQENTESSETDALKLGVSQTKKRPAGWLETRFIEASREIFEVGRQRGTATLLVPGISWSRSIADSSLSPDRGHRLFVELRGGTESLLSDANFLRARMSAVWLRRFPWGGRIITRGEFGAMQVNRFDALPPSLRFFAGGDNSVRGYEFQSLGPEDAGGNVIGGNFLAVGSVEYEHPVAEKWSVAAFVDSGNAFSDTARNNGFNTGIGVGARWASPIGPVRIDLAHPLDDDTLVRLHLRLGPDL